MDTGEWKVFTPQECEMILRSSWPSRELKLLSYEVRKGPSELLGFMGEYYNLSVCVEDRSLPAGKRQLRYFVKTVPLLNAFHKAECERKGFFLKETRIYTHILSNIQKYASSQLTPVCYYTRSDLIVMEDLSLSSHNLRQMGPHEVYTMKHLQVVLEHQAKLHAAGIAWEVDQHLNIGERFKDVLIEMQLTMRNEWYVTGIQSILFLAHLHPDFQHPRCKKFIEEELYDLLSNAEVLAKPSKRLRNVFCHGDSWDRNIFFKFNASGEPIDCRIVDFQLSRYCPPALDVLFFIFANTSPEQRELILDECVDFYLKSLGTHLKTLDISECSISRSDFTRDCKTARFAVLILLAICEPLMKMPAGLANQMRRAEPEKFDFYMNSKRDELFERIIEIEPAYRDVILRPVKELLEYLMDNENIYSYLD